MVKSANTAQSESVTTKDTPSIGQRGDSIHPELYRYFSVNPIEDGGQADKLSFLNKWAFEDDSVGKALSKIRSAERKLGSPRVDESRLDKVFNWVRITSHITETEEDMKKELSLLKEKEKQSIKQVKDSVQPEIEKLQSRIKELESRYRGATESYRINATDTARTLKNKYSRELKELKERRKAYGGK